MLLTVFYKSGTEKSYKNVTDVHTSVRYDDESEKPVDEIRFTSLGDLSAVTLHNVNGFEIKDVNDTYFCRDGIYYCASCGAAFPAITKSEIDRYKFCPYCGRRF